MAVVERICDAEVRVFKWNESERISSNEVEGVLMVRVLFGEIKTGFLKKKIQRKVRAFSFNFDSLQSRDSLKSLADLSNHLPQQIFLKESNARILSAMIFENLVGNFQFTSILNSSSPSRKPKIVIVIDAFVESSPLLEEDFPNEEEEEEEECSSCEYGNIEQEMASSNTLSVDGNHDQQQEETEILDMDYDLTDLEVEEEGEVDSDVELEQAIEDEEDLMDDDNIVSNIMVDKKGDSLDILSALRSNLLIEPIAATHEPYVLKQIEIAVKVTRWIDDDRAAADTCSICLKKFLMGTLISTTPCSHVFHRSCLKRWLPKNSSCPMCRTLCATIVHI
ncbi:E3 ubiquitin-protein ligase SDIR1-like [Cornus florida]|uniref:E3 ubiquitin-protein ligase SDIR1-like n=1 Tax=Cornus florida TaxID=4283 RepID=UPI0028A15C96|nr:E3 ubiquitin-protein ligase SDIR1-like [Cornus florida]